MVYDNIDLYIVRHAETYQNIEARIQGQMESSLTPRGIRQAHYLGEALKGADIRYILSSDLGRARQTSQMIKRYLGDVEIAYTPDLRERSFGRLEGKLVSECGLLDAEDIYPDEGGALELEPLSGVMQRMQVVSHRLRAEGPCLIVGHECSNSYLINELLQEGFIFHPQDNCSIHRLVLKDDVEICRLNIRGGDYR